MHLTQLAICTLLCLLPAATSLTIDKSWQKSGVFRLLVEAERDVQVDFLAWKQSDVSRPWKPNTWTLARGETVNFVHYMPIAFMIRDKDEMIVNVTISTRRGELIETYVANFIPSIGEYSRIALQTPGVVRMIYKFDCNENFYGAQCDVMCIANERRNCSSDGAWQCNEGWTGPACERPICSGGCGSGKCVAPDTCECSDGFKGARCETCVPSDGCLHGGCWKNKIPGTCACEKGWYGPKCDKDVHYCANNANVCLNGGRCLNGGNGTASEFHCSCAIGYAGERCEKRLECKINLCFNGGKCHPTENSFTCDCAEGFEGTLCEKHIVTEDIVTTVASKCTARTCKNGGTCVDGFAVPVCVCAACYSGADCLQRDDECLSRNANTSGSTTAEVKRALSDRKLLVVLFVASVFCTLLTLITCAWLLVLRRRARQSDDDEQNENSKNEKKLARLGSSFWTSGVGLDLERMDYKVAKKIIDDTCKLPSPCDLSDGRYTLAPKNSQHRRAQPPHRQVTCSDESIYEEIDLASPVSTVPPAPSWAAPKTPKQSVKSGRFISSPAYV